ncbi:3-dehydro-L-gulonate 2-dehydrogenase [Segetibacter koreensis]|uniref:3-dehydro-L-gulonate 2-dehydrogenase n=1 Tax=Segetibacter koreensis TaxID=398037 RepID=UPI0003814595|nr:3-dehydro-L-gulonate 2-dehydrogenase [Segetibacter koreensis]
MSAADEVRVSFAEMESVFHNILLRHSFDVSKAALCAHIFADNSLDGVYTHGVNRFARFVKMVADKHVLPDQEPTKVSGFGGLEQWNGNLGAGPSNAVFCTERALRLADENGIGCVALANTNHWMRGGTYGWKAAKKGYAFICWTNTIANMPAWGAKDNHLGNNPLILAIPKDNEAVVLDMAISQFSFGAMEKFTMEKKPLPVPGGYDEMGQLTTDAQKVLETQRSLPIGFWKGSGLSLLLDLLATVLSGGKSTFQITEQKIESAVSQVFIAIRLTSLNNSNAIKSVIDSIIADYHSSAPASPFNKILYPSERVLATRKNNTEKGIPVNKRVWDEILAL